MGSGLVNATAWRVTRRRSLWGAAETACNSNSTVRRVVSRKRDAVRLKAVRRDRRLFRRAFFQIKWANFIVESYHRLQPQARELCSSVVSFCAVLRLFAFSVCSLYLRGVLSCP